MAHSQVAASLVDAWDQFNKNMEDPDDVKKKQEIEKAIGNIVQDIWLKKLEDLKQRDQNQAQNQSLSQMNVLGAL